MFLITLFQHWYDSNMVPVMSRKICRFLYSFRLIAFVKCLEAIGGFAALHYAPILLWTKKVTKSWYRVIPRDTAWYRACDTAWYRSQDLGHDLCRWWVLLHRQTLLLGGIDNRSGPLMRLVCSQISEFVYQSFRANPPNSQTSIELVEAFGESVGSIEVNISSRKQYYFAIPWG